MPEKRKDCGSGGTRQYSILGPDFESSGEALGKLFLQSVDLLCIADLDSGFFLLLNPAWATTLGWGADELLGQPFIDFVHPDDRQRTVAEVANLSTGTPAAFFENRYRHQDGSYRWLQWNARSEPNEGRIYASARDITERRKLQWELLDVVDHERGRLGREMHDGLCQTLAGIAALAATLSNRLAHTAELDAQEHATEIGSLLRHTIRDARDMARGLDPIGIHAVGLNDALDTLASSVQRMFGVNCCATCDSDQLVRHKEIELHLFRITQEAVNNAVKHGHADTIDIVLSHADDEATLSIKDNGSGLPAHWSDSKGIGMKTMAYRAQLINASLEFRRRSERGTSVICTFPLLATAA